MIREKQFAIAAITASDVSVYTVPAGSVAMLKSYDVCNTTGGAVSLYVNIVPSGDSVGTANAHVYSFSITSHDTIPWRGTIVMEAGDSLSVKGSATGLTIIASGVERQL